MQARSATFLIGLLLSPALQLRGQSQDNVRRVEIKSTSFGLARSSKVDLLIERDGDAYRANGQTVDAMLVRALSRALAEPANPGLILGDLGITPEWLSANASIYTRQEIIQIPEPTAQQEALFERMFKDSSVVESALPAIYKSRHTDDNPFVELEATFEDGSIVSVSSRSQHAFMLPWQLVRDGERSTAYNADISRAIAALMPPKSANLARIAGNGLAFELARTMMMSIETDDRRRQQKVADQEASEAMSVLQPAYRVFFPEIRTNDHADQWSSTGSRDLSAPEPTDVYASLSSDRLPSNFTEDVIFRYRDGKALGTSEFLRKARGLENTVFAVPWLNSFIRTNPQILFRMSYVYSASLTDRALDAFASEMRAIGKNRLAAEVTAEKGRTVLFFTGRSLDQATWLVLPDERVVLWRYDGVAVPSLVSAKLLQWNVSDLCGAEAGRRCAGAEIAPEGDLKTK